MERGADKIRPCKAFFNQSPYRILNVTNNNQSTMKLKRFQQSLASFFRLLVKKEGRRFLRIYKNSIVLSSMKKSGTNYLRLILTNYFTNITARNLEVKGDYKKIEYDEMHKEIFPNISSYIFNEKSSYNNPSIKLLAKIGYEDFMYDHGSYSNSFPINLFIRPRKTILLYRNPYDIIISRYYYFYNNRLGVENYLEHPRELIEEYIPHYATKYSWMKNQSKKDKNSILISYEELKTKTEETVRKILTHLGIPIDYKLLIFAISSSSIENVKKTEKRMGTAIHSPKEGLKGSFVRSGAIGQWRDYFSEKDIEKINRILLEKKLDLGDFVFKI